MPQRDYADLDDLATDNAVETLRKLVREQPDE